MSNYPTHLIESPFAKNGDKTIPPLTPTLAGEGHFSQREGFGILNSTPLEDGGVPPYRGDMNGALFLLSNLLFWYQQGGVMNWVSSLTYEVGNEVFYNGTKYRCIQQCTNEVPTNRTYWRNLDLPSVRAGMVIAAYNVTVNSAGNPIFWGETEADTGYLLCDGRATGISGINTPNLIGKMIRGSTPANAGQTGGADSVTLDNTKIPAHSHTVTIESGGTHGHTASSNNTGGHTHTRGTMNITGRIAMARTGNGWVPGNPSGALSYDGNWNAAIHNGADDDWGSWIKLNAANGWSGSTSTDGAHSHTITVNNGGSHTHTATCSTAGQGAGSISSIDIKNPFYTLAYFVRLPEV